MHNAILRERQDHRNIEISSYDDRFTSNGIPIACVVDEPTKTCVEMFISRQEVDTFIDYLMEHHRYRSAALFIFLLNTGFRVTDGLSFRVGDLRNKDIISCKDDITIVERKTRRTGKTRTVYFNDGVKTVLEYLMNGKADNEYVFTPDSGEKFNAELGVVQPMDRKSVYAIVRKAVAACGIDVHGGSHTMRKTFTYFMGQNGGNINLDLACRALGHSDSRITQKHYLNTPERIIREKILELNLGLDVWNKWLKKRKFYRKKEN